MSRRVVVTGVGMLSALGDSAADLHAALCAGQTSLSSIKAFDTAGLGCQLAAQIDPLPARDYLGKKGLRPLDRTSRLVAIAGKLALDASGWSEADLEQHEVGLVLGTMYCSVHTIAGFDRRAQVDGVMYASPMDFANTVINAAAGQAAIRHNLRGLNSTISAGPRSGLEALAYAADTIRRGEYQALLAGGAEELCFESFQAFARAGQLCGSGGGDGEHPIPFDVRRNGFALGEGSALLMLEDAERAAARGAEVLAEVKGSASTFNPSRDGADDDTVAAIAAAIDGALRSSDLTPDQIDCVSVAGNGSRREDRLEALALEQSLGDRVAEIPVTAIKGVTGEMLGASGAFQAVAMIEAMRSATAPGVAALGQLDPELPLAGLAPSSREGAIRHALLDAVGFDGSASALVLAAPA